MWKAGGIEVGVARGSTIHSSTRLAVFLLIAKHIFYMNSFLKNSSFQQSKLESSAHIF